MQSVIYRRGMTRNLVSNVINECCNFLTNSSLLPNHLVNRLLNLRFISQASINFNQSRTSCKTSPSSQPVQIPSLHLVTVYSGFSKDLTKPLCKKGVIGDDAWFVATHKCADILGK